MSVKFIPCLKFNQKYGWKMVLTCGSAKMLIQIWWEEIVPLSETHRCEANN